MVELEAAEVHVKAPEQPKGIHSPRAISGDPHVFEVQPPSPAISGDGPQVFEVRPPPPIGWRQALAAGWTSGLPDKSGIAFYAREVLLGIIICTAHIPEAIAFSYLAHVRAPVALHTAWIIGLTCAVLGGRPTMVSGATGAFGAIINTFIAPPLTPGGNSADIALLFPSVMVAGFLMILVWLLKLDRFVTLLPLPVMIGFCNGLAIVIGKSQMWPFKIPCAAGSDPGETCWRTGAEAGWMVLILLTSMAIMEFLPKIPKPRDIREKALWKRPFAALAMVLLELPSSFLSIVASVLLEFVLIRPLGYHTVTIGDAQGFTATDAYPRPFFVKDADPTSPYNYDLSLLHSSGAVGTIITNGILLAAVGCIESLITAEVVTEYVRTPNHPGLVVAAMGLGNIIAGFFGGMGGNAMIGMSTVTCLSGGRGRVAPTSAALAILIIVTAAYQALNFIPVAALSGIMYVVVLHTFKWFSFPLIISALLPQRARTAASTKWFSFQLKVVRMDIVVMLITSVLIAITNIVYGVGIGLAISCAVYAWDTASSLSVSYYLDRDETGKPLKVYQVRGPLFFAATRKFSACFSPETDPALVVVIFGSGTVHDYTQMDAMASLSAAYRAQGKRVEFRNLNARSDKMLRKASALTENIEYRTDAFESADGYLSSAHTKGLRQKNNFLPLPASWGTVG